MASSSFFLGGVIDPASGARTDELVQYDADDLTTHGVIVGMTGSGKTGLGVIYLEEALRRGIPTLVLDPKGDMTNLLLTFPELQASDFRPWIDEGEARRQDRTPDELAEDTAGSWRKGLASWGLGGDDIAELRQAAGMTVYTPGSGAGVPLNVVGSLDAPDLDWDSEAETIRDEIQGFVSGVLGLVGIDSDPLSSREHILLSNIVEAAWVDGEDLDLETLLGRVHRPPMRKLGVFEVDTFFPEKDRLELAMKLNALVASPAFAAWRDGPPLDIERMLWDADGRPQAAIIYLAHLSDDERQFVVTMVLSRLITWMRSQPGSSELRALVYMDEVFGFVPPTAAPPAKRPILTILKQARAFGVGMLLSTQNPVDLDYKAMSNAGTWCVGRLQTERDKARILEALQSATGEADISHLDTLISGLDKRQFVLHNTRDRTPTVFGTRWAMSYLRGPLTREQISTLTADDERRHERPEPTQATAPLPDDATVAAPVVADGITVHHLDPGAPWADEVGAVRTGSTYQAALVARVHLRFDDRYADVDHEEVWEAVYPTLQDRFDATTGIAVDHDDRDFLAEPPGKPTYRIPDAPIDKASYFKDAGRSIQDHVHRHRSIEVFRNKPLKLYSRVGETRDEVEGRCARTAEAEVDRAIAKLRDRFENRIDSMRDAIEEATRKVDDAEFEVSSSRQEEVLSGAGTILDILLGRKGGRSTTATSRRTSRRSAERRLRTAEDRLADKVEDLEELQEDLADEIEEVTEEWRERSEAIEPVEIGLEKSDISVDEVALCWIPVA